MKVDLAPPLTMRLEQFTRFTTAERTRVDALSAYPYRTFEAGEAIISEGERAEAVILIQAGLAIRSKSLRDGSRQIMACLLPGDLCDLEVFVLQSMDHDLIAVGPTACSFIPTADVEGLLSEFSVLTKALWWSTMTDAAVLRSRIIGAGRRDALERLAHLFYELLIRHRIIEAAPNDTYRLPLAQHELADMAGLTLVHTNRTLSKLRAAGLVDFHDGWLQVLDAEGLKRLAKFESNYLHLARTERFTDVSHRASDLI